MSIDVAIRRLHAPDEAEIDALAAVLIDCVEGGASVSFMHPLSPARAQAFWRRVAEGARAGERALLVAEDAQGMSAPCSSCSSSRRTSRTAPTWPRCSCTAAHAARGSARR